MLLLCGFVGACFGCAGGMLFATIKWCKMERKYSAVMDEMEQNQKMLLRDNKLLIDHIGRLNDYIRAKIK